MVLTKIDDRGLKTPIDLQDNEKIRLGTGNDLQIYHDGSHSRIDDTGTGSLVLRSSNFLVEKYGGDYMIHGVADGAVELYHDGSKKFETRTNGIGVEGDTTFQTGSRHKFIGGSSSNLELGTYSSNNTSRNIGMVLDSSGNVGIGTTSPNRNLVVSDGTNSIISVQNSNQSTEGVFNAPSGATINLGTTGSYSLTLSTNNVERMVIDSSGNKFLDNSFSTTNANVRKSYFTNTGQQIHARNAHEAMIVFQKPDGTQIGSIARTVNNVAYNTSSDYRLKENVSKISDGITRLKQLKPSRFNFISDPDITMDGFIAHEVTAVPEAITGTKDEVDSDNNPVYQGIDQSKLVPLLTAALQEAVARIEALEAA
tara:strand:+ start:61 stop:1164 length:1104 start_codon:yes stop_codon:yes gene_type:complete